MVEQIPLRQRAVFQTMRAADLKVRRSITASSAGPGPTVPSCTLSHHVEWHMREALKPLLFHDGATGGGIPCRARGAVGSLLPDVRLS